MMLSLDVSTLTTWPTVHGIVPKVFSFESLWKTTTSFNDGCCDVLGHREDLGIKSEIFSFCQTDHQLSWTDCICFISLEPESNKGDPTGDLLLIRPNRSLLGQMRSRCSKFSDLLPRHIGRLFRWSEIMANAVSYDKMSSFKSLKRVRKSCLTSLIALSAMPLT